AFRRLVPLLLPGEPDRGTGDQHPDGPRRARHAGRAAADRAAARGRHGTARRRRLGAARALAPAPPPRARPRPRPARRHAPRAATPGEQLRAGRRVAGPEGPEVVLRAYRPTDGELVVETEPAV